MKMPREEVIKIVDERIDEEHLDLSGIVVLTEAATGVFAVTPAIVQRSGGKVLALAKDSEWGTVLDCMRAVNTYVKGVQFIGDKEWMDSADIVANTGHLRPITRKDMEKMKRGAVIAMMMEVWEWSNGDVDLEAAKELGVRLVSVDESDIHPYDGELAVRLLHEAGYTVRNTRIRVLGIDRVAYLIRDYLHSLGAILVEEGAEVTLVASFRENSTYDLSKIDNPIVIGNGGKMPLTSGYISPRPVIELHTKALKEACKAWHTENS